MGSDLLSEPALNRGAGGGVCVDENIETPNGRAIMKTLNPNQLAHAQGGLLARSFHATGPCGGQFDAFQVRGPFAGVGVYSVTAPWGATRTWVGHRRF